MKIKNVLILYKRSSYSIYFEGPQSSLKGRGIAPSEMTRFKKTHQEHAESLRHIEGVLKKSGLKYFKIPRGGKVNFSPFDLIITVGGDGTFLEAARSVKNQLILGVNSDPSWSVGRFCSTTAQDFEGALSKLLSGKASIKKFSRIKLQTPKQASVVLNDILICHHNPAAMSRYYLSVGNIKESQKSSGIWISTAAGSSGAIKSAGGKTLPPESPRIQYKPRELYSGKGHVYKLKGAVLSPSSKIKVTSLMREGFIFVDGSHICFPFDFGETITVSRSPHPLNVVWAK